MLHQPLNVAAFHGCLNIIHSHDTNPDVVVLLWFIPSEIVLISLSFSPPFRINIEVRV
jgi:hypothetical protein